MYSLGGLWSTNCTTTFNSSRRPSSMTPTDFWRSVIATGDLITEWTNSAWKNYEQYQQMKWCLSREELREETSQAIWWRFNCDRLFPLLPHEWHPLKKQQREFSCQNYGNLSVDISSRCYLAFLWIQYWRCIQGSSVGPILHCRSSFAWNYLFDLSIISYPIFLYNSCLLNVYQSFLKRV